jgi:hypothetical protein
MGVGISLLLAGVDGLCHLLFAAWRRGNPLDAAASQAFLFCLCGTQPTSDRNLLAQGGKAVRGSTA